MCNRNDCGILEVFVNDMEKLVRAVLIEVRSGFIQDKDFGAAKQRPCRTKQLTLAIAQLPDETTREMQNDDINSVNPPPQTIDCSAYSPDQ